MQGAADASVFIVGRFIWRHTGLRVIHRVCEQGGNKADVVPCDCLPSFRHGILADLKIKLDEAGFKELASRLRPDTKEIYPEFLEDLYITVFQELHVEVEN